METAAEDVDNFSFSFGSKPLLRLLTLCAGEAAVAAASACAFSSACFCRRVPTILIYQFARTEATKLVAAATDYIFLLPGLSSNLHFKTSKKGAFPRIIPT